MDRGRLTGVEYVADVLEGRIVTGELVRQACERHVRDVETGAERGLRFVPEIAERAIAFFGFLRHSKGEWAGMPILLELWQQFIVGSTFGWLRGDGTRRFRTVYCEVARKNGKSTTGAGIGNYCFTADGEPGAEVYSAATTRDQARIVFDEAARMCQRSPALRRRVVRIRNNLSVPATASSFAPLASNDETLDGLNRHCAIVDEVHAHRNRDLWDVLETAGGSRRQPLMVGMTTAGREVTSFCGELHDYGRRVLNGALVDDTYFAYIAGLDDGDAWDDPDVWIKANPNLGVSVKVEGLVDQCERAKQDPTFQNAFRRLRLNQWIGSATRFIDLAEWDACTGGIDVEELERQCHGRRAYGGLDLASTIDLAALAFVLPPEEPGGPFDLIVRIFMPGDAAHSREKQRRDRVPYGSWVDRGAIIATPGNVIDYDCIRAELELLDGVLEIQQVGYDPWGAAQFANELEGEGFCMVPIRQGFGSMSNPTKELARIVRSSRLRHGGHPVLRWMADNLTTAEDAAGNIKPDRKKSRQKIDGLVASIMALDRAIRNEGPGDHSVYATQDGLALV